MNLPDVVALLLIGVGLFVLWRDHRRSKWDRETQQAIALARHPARRAQLNRQWGRCACGLWTQPTSEPWSHKADRCQPLREATRGFDR